MAGSTKEEIASVRGPTQTTFWQVCTSYLADTTKQNQTDDKHPDLCHDRVSVVFFLSSSDLVCLIPMVHSASK